MPSSANKPDGPQDDLPPRGRVTPRSFWRTVRKPVKWVLVYWFTGLLFLVMSVVLTVTIRGNSYLPCALCFVVLAGVAVGWEAWLRKRRALRAPGNCQSCGYSLEGLAAAGKCPECGMEYQQQDP